MNPEEVIQLFDSCWFEMEILREKPSSFRSPSFEANPDREDQENSSETEITVFTRMPKTHTRSMSDQLSSIMYTSFSSSDSLSPDSVFFTSKLHPVLSGKEMTMDIANSSREIEEITRKKKMVSTRKKGTSKSLSELEFEELKGFMDLGFVFTEEDNKDSRLVEIVPGLQRLGKKKDDEIKQSDEVEEAVVSRPYLSEAWEVMDRRRKEKPLMNWRVPNSSNEIDIKDNLRWWAHAVASTVR
ncbi:hypothetical protein SLEP1_g7872 [Rubroshorea leprosula]|uniref:DUF1685 family protein n=1 Tax=Rubroshorea leprosula TaxID=152421 RepID=A0AAV5I5U1_9ROSI|nr:hypothetical protein SLEP1_g7872 [Rubroshorea leprosula]